jgi:hypothetical protein
MMEVIKVKSGKEEKDKAKFDTQKIEFDSKFMEFHLEMPILQVNSYANLVIRYFGVN